MEERSRILAINDLQISIQNRKVVNGVSIDLYEGETLAIVGESGSGKSLTAMSVLQLLGPDFHTTGKINYNTDLGVVDLLKSPKKQLQRYRGNEIAMIFQNPMTTLNPLFTCGEQIVEILLKHFKFTKKEAKIKAMDLLNEVHFKQPERIFNSYPHQLSGGQLQRMVIAMAVSCSPRILIADEPTTALDVTTQTGIMELLQELKAKHKMSIVFITHDLSLLSGFADFVCVMRNGNLLEYGPAKDVLEFPREPYTMGLLACRPRIEDNWKYLPTLSDFEVDGGESIFNDSNRRTAISLDRDVLISLKGINLEVRKESGWMAKSKKLQILKDVSFDIYQGETLGVLGRSGSGKSTVSKCIVQLIKAYSGAIYYKGVNLKSLSRKEIKAYRKDVQLIFQDPYTSLNPRLTVGSQIVEAMKVHDVRETPEERKAFALELLDKIGIPRKEFNKYPHEFSGGQRQRIGIARVLALEPKFIICDESVSALDVSVQAQILNLLTSLKEEFGLTILFISHDISVVKHMADRVIVMSEGEVVEVNEAEKLWLSPQKEFTKTLLKNSRLALGSNQESALLGD